MIGITNNNNNIKDTSREKTTLEKNIIIDKINKDTSKEENTMAKNNINDKIRQEKETQKKNDTNMDTAMDTTKVKETLIQTKTNKNPKSSTNKTKEKNMDNKIIKETIKDNAIKKKNKNNIDKTNKKDSTSVKEKAITKNVNKVHGRDSVKENEKTIENNNEIEKRSFRKDCKGISRRLVNLFYAEIKINSWQMSTDFNQKFDARALSFISYYWSKLKISRKNYVLILLLTLTNKRIVELNKNSEFKKFLEKIENESNNPKMGLDKRLVSAVLSILYNKLVNLQINGDKDERMKNYKPIQYDISKIKNTVMKYKCNSPLFIYVNHKKRDEIKIPGKIKWKSNQVLPSENERMNNYRKLNYFKNRTLDEFMRPRNIFEPVVTRENQKDTPSFLRSRHNFAGKNTFVNKSISIPRIEKSMLASNRDNKLVLLEQQDVEKLKMEEKLRQEEERRLKESREEEKKKKKLKRKKSTSQSDSTKRHKRRRKRKVNDENNNNADNDNNNDNNETDYYETDNYETDNYETDYYETDNYETDKETSNPKSNNKSNKSFTEIIVLDSSSDEENPSHEIVSSPMSIVNSPGSPLIPITLSPTNDMDITASSPAQPNILMDVSRQNSNRSYSESSYTNDNSSPVIPVIKVPDYLKNVNINAIACPANNLSPLNPDKYLYDNNNEINNIFNSNWITEESNKIIKKYFNVQSIDNDNETEVDEEDNNEGYKNNIYLRIHNFNKMSKIEQMENPIEFKYDYFPSKYKDFPNPINNFLSLSIEEQKLLNKYKNIE